MRICDPQLLPSHDIIAHLDVGNLPGATSAAEEQQATGAPGAAAAAALGAQGTSRAAPPAAGEAAATTVAGRPEGETTMGFWSLVTQTN